ncbi:MAG: hypothetical protein ACI8QC_002460 [Planctomycetota bacterium]|jgi:hypothetical protein
MGQALRAVLVIGLLGVLFVWSALRQDGVDREALAASMERALASGLLPVESVGHQRLDARTEAWFTRLSVPLLKLPMENVPMGLGGSVSSSSVSVMRAPTAVIDADFLDELSVLLASAPRSRWSAPKQDPAMGWGEVDTVLRQLLGMAKVARRESARLAGLNEYGTALGRLSLGFEICAPMQVFSEPKLIQVSRAQAELLKGLSEMLALPGEGPLGIGVDLAQVRAVLGTELEAGAGRMRARAGLPQIFDGLLAVDRQSLFLEEQNMEGLVQSLEWLERLTIGDDPNGRIGFTSGRVIGKEHAQQRILAANSCWLGSQRQYAHALALLVLLEQAVAKGEWPGLLPVDAPMDPVTGAPFLYTLTPERIELRAQPVRPVDPYLSLPEPPSWDRTR